jgi:isoquinoline 1-oxidoreductase beta subunit
VTGRREDKPAVARAMPHRRAVLKGAAAALVVPFAPLPGLTTPSQAMASDIALTAFLRIEASGRILVLSPTLEMGQGTHTAHAMILADELGANLADIRVETARPAPDYGRLNPTNGTRSMNSGGSWGVRYWYMPLRRVGAQARAMLLEAAAERLSVPVRELTSAEGRVTHRASKRTLSFGELVGLAATKTPPAEPVLRPDSELRYIGRNVARLDLPAKVTGAQIYGFDLKLPGMVYALHVKCPAFGGHVERLDATAARAVRGVVRVIERADGPVVVAETMWAAIKAAGVLNIAFAGDTALTSTAISARMREGLSAPEALPSRRDGDASAALAASTRVIEHDYEVPFIAHQPMETFNLTLTFTGDRLEAWSAFQMQDRQRATLARLAGLPVDAVTLNTVAAGGAFGRRFDDSDFGAAVDVARQMRRPVKYVWRREEETTGGGYRPAQMARLRAGLDAQGRITALTIRVSGTSILHDFAAQRGTALDFTNVQVLSDTRYRPAGGYSVDYAKRQEPVPSMFWRAVGATQNGFFLERFIDEVAQAAGRDEVEMRRELLAHDPRALRVVNTAAARGGWGTPLAAGRARGFAYVESYGSLCAQVIEASLVGGRPLVHRVTCALDCGAVVMPDGVRSQVEGGIIQAVSAALAEKITLTDGRASQANFDTYPILRIDEANFPIELHIIASGETMGGVGEPPVPPVAPALASAVSKLTGRPVRSLPLVDAIRV